MTTSPLVFAMSFPAWVCRDCRMVVEWEDAAIEWDEGKPVGVRCVDCQNPEASE